MVSKNSQLFGHCKFFFPDNKKEAPLETSSTYLKLLHKFITLIHILTNQLFQPL